MNQPEFLQQIVAQIHELPEGEKQQWKSNLEKLYQYYEKQPAELHSQLQSFNLELQKRFVQHYDMQIDQFWKSLQGSPLAKQRDMEFQQRVRSLPGNLSELEKMMKLVDFKRSFVSELRQIQMLNTKEGANTMRSLLQSLAKLDDDGLQKAFAALSLDWVKRLWECKDEIGKEIPQRMDEDDLEDENFEEEDEAEEETVADDEPKEDTKPKSKKSTKRRATSTVTKNQEAFAKLMTIYSGCKRSVDECDWREKRQNMELCARYGSRNWSTQEKDVQKNLQETIHICENSKQLNLSNLIALGKLWDKVFKQWEENQRKQGTPKTLWVDFLKNINLGPGIDANKSATYVSRLRLLAKFVRAYPRFAFVTWKSNSEILKNIKAISTYVERDPHEQEFWKSFGSPDQTSMNANYKYEGKTIGSIHLSFNPEKFSKRKQDLHSYMEVNESLELEAIQEQQKLKKKKT